MRLILVGIAVLFLAACSSDPDPMGTADSGGGGNPDAATGDPDATTGQPDATTGQPDATTGEPDATADGGGGNPDAEADGGIAMRDSGVPNDLTCNPSFGMANACGGDPVGSWTYRAGCSDESDFDQYAQQCGGQVSNEARTASGSLVINANGTFTRNVDTVATADITIGGACVTIAGGCPGVESAIEGTSPSTVANCTGTTTCNCNVTQMIGTHDTGTWSTDNNGVLTAMTTSATRAHWYCVNGDVARYRGHDNDTTSYVIER